MTYTSPAFLCFVFGAWILHAAFPKKFRWAVLLAVSLAFYSICDLRAGIWLVLCTLATFFGGWLVYGQKNKTLKKVLLAATLLSVFGLLFVFKFAGFAANLLPSLLGGFSKGLLLPLGISFYIFQSAGYVIDLYRKKYAPEKNIAKYALFVSFFPQIIQGPIGRYDRLAPQLFSGEKPGADSYRHGIQLVLWGLFKKMIIADRAALIVEGVFKAPELHGGIVSAAAAAFYCIQIYCDFSGGIDISRGVAEGFGISLDKNFEQPLFAVSVQDFWRRWHITLGSWMRDYLFYPLSLSRRFGKLGRSMRKLLGVRLGKMIPSLFATFIVFFVIGIWHGGAWKYIIFGLWNGLLLSSAMFAEPLFAKMRKAAKVSDKSKFWHGFRIVRTLLIVGAGRILTRANNTSEALIMLKNIFTSPKSSHVIAGAFMNFGLSAQDYIVMAGAFAVLVISDIIEERGIPVRHFIEKRSPVLQVLAIVFALFALLYFGAYRDGYISPQFVYAGF
ncbi:MAG: MBOAT family protein [Oscillospiraceae bacterium]|nr:MBOAT family protein [Oscillospiraceae bacterium]